MSYLIRHQGNPDLVLAQLNGLAVVAWRDVDDKNQLWDLTPIWKEKRAYQLRNAATGHDLSCEEYGDNVRCVAGKSTPWQVCGEFSEFGAIRVFGPGKDGWNLNLLGSAPYDVGRSVGVWNWNNGKPNERWSIADAATTPNPPGRFWQLGNAERESGLIAPPDGDLAGASHLIFERNGGGVGPGSPARTFYEKVDYRDGFTLRNKYNKKFIKWCGNNLLLQQQGTMALDCLWTAGVIQPAIPRESLEIIAIRPWRNIDQNISIVRSNEPPAICTRGWRDGEAQRWSLHPG